MTDTEHAGDGPCMSCVSVWSAGCSFSWEDKLAQASLLPRHIKMGRNVPMYRCVCAHLRGSSSR